MNTPDTFIRYSLRNRLFVLAGATFLLCALVILLFFPLLNFTLTGLQDRTINSMQEATEVEATTIARRLGKHIIVTPFQRECGDATLASRQPGRHLQQLASGNEKQRRRQVDPRQQLDLRVKRLR